MDQYEDTHKCIIGQLNDIADLLQRAIDQGNVLLYKKYGTEALNSDMKYAVYEGTLRALEEHAKRQAKLEIGASQVDSYQVIPAQLPRNDERYHHDPSRFYWDPSTRRYEEKPHFRGSMPRDA